MRQPGWVGIRSCWPVLDVPLPPSNDRLCWLHYCMMVWNGSEKKNTCDHTLHQIMDRITLIESDACDGLKNLACAPDVVYLDPMYPNRNTTAMVKKEMRICRKLVGDDQDIDQLMIVAMDTARKRVVVKRHTHTPPTVIKPIVVFFRKKSALRCLSKTPAMSSHEIKSFLTSLHQIIFKVRFRNRFTLWLAPTRAISTET